jgi:hypothetical protein
MSYSCSQCPVQTSALAARPAVVRLDTDGKTWTGLSEQTPVHLVALFRDPAIVDSRIVSVVLDLSSRPDGSLSAGRACWVEPFLKALSGLPPGLTVALDNGVRCPYPQQAGNYAARVRLCLSQTQKWITSLEHPEGGRPGLLICDKDLACAYTALGLLTRRNGEAWQAPARFLDAVGDEVVFNSGTAVCEAIILAHPVLFSRRHASIYTDAFKRQQVVAKITKPARSWEKQFG